MRGSAILAAVVLVGGCANASSPPPAAAAGARLPSPSPSAAAAARLPSPAAALGEPIATFVLVSPPAGVRLGCMAYGVLPHWVSGTLEGAPGDPERVWLLGPAGDRISIAWPAGFSLHFTPDARLDDAAGRLFASAGDQIVLGQVRVGSHSGTRADPYLAAGLIEARSARGDIREVCAPPAVWAR